VVAKRIPEQHKMDEEEKEKEDQNQTGKRKRTDKKTQETKRPSHANLDQWSLLPKKEAKWMRELLEIPGESFLTILPCIRDEKIMPSEVFHIINSGRGTIVFYANVVHVTLCPRHLVHNDSIHRHHNDSVVAICITEKIAGGGKDEKVNRLFVRCFSEKCLHLRKESHTSKWEEYKECHYTRYTRLLLVERRKKMAAADGATAT
jgi:hypothetical protein